MTENQLFPMSADIFDNSSNSSNPLKYDLYSSLGLSNSNSQNTIFATYSPTHPLSSTMNNLNNSQHTNVSSNVMLTNAISIPRSNNPNQCHKHYSTDDIMQHHHHHQTSPSPLQQQMMAAQNQQQQQQYQQQQQQQQLPLHIQTNGLLAELSDYGLDALESSLSPTLLQDVSLNSTSPLQCININGNLSVSLVSDNNNSYYAQSAGAASPPMGIGVDMGQLSNSGDSNSGIGSITSDGVNCMLLSGLNASATTSSSTSASNNNNLNIGHDDDGNSSMLYSVLDDGNTNSNNLWNDINSAITTKNEPFSIDDDYIFHTDKVELQEAGFGALTDDNFLQVMDNIDDYLKTTIAASANEENNSAHNDLYNNAHSQLNSSEQQQQQQQQSQISPVSQLPLNILEQQHQQQICQQQHDYEQLQSLASQQQQQQQQQQQLQHSKAMLQQNNGNNNGSAGGAIHHTHSRHNSSSPYEIYHSTPNKLQQQHLNSSTFSPGSQPSQSPLQLNSVTPPPHANRLHYQQNMVKSRNMQELLKKGFSMSPDRNILGQSVPNTHILITGSALSPSGSGSSGFGSATTRSITTSSNRNSAKKLLAYQNDNSISRLSSSAPTHLGFDHIWMRREPRQHLLSTGSLVEAESISSLSTGSVLSPDAIDFSQDDDDDASTDYNSDNYDDFSSDNGSYNDEDGRTVSMQRLSGKGKERYFWQYNVQAKGPKGKRLVFQSKLEDPHVLNEATDPVFSPNCSVRGIKVFKHSGKARKGDGNDLTPNARKLQSIGRELDKLNRTINDMTPVSELPFNVRPKSRKEKNKLASRACRLKKKAQHEANKIKLFGLELEHKRLLTGIAEMKQALALKYSNQHAVELREEIDKQIDFIYRTAKTGVNIAGTTTEFVNKVLENVKNGLPNGGLDELKNT